MSNDKDERAKIEAGMKKVEERIEADMDPYVSASQMDTDEVIAMDRLRPWLSALVEMTYQGIGHRRIKNSRIWSMHDLGVLTSGRGR
jgi:acetyl-CoA carboxylase carboxyltransferase component